MRAFGFLVAGLATLALASAVVAQYGEECHYECIQIYCDLFDDYCDYDCHEVCYPYRAAKSNSPQLSADGHRVAQVKVAQVRSAFHRHQPLRHDLKHELETSSTGKVVRMRLNKNASLPAASRTKTASAPTRSSASVASFALFQNCLSERTASEA